MLTLSMILTAASLVMHGISYLWGGNDVVKTVTNAVDTGAALTGGAVASSRGNSTATTNQTVKTSTNAAGQTVRDHR